MSRKTLISFLLLSCFFCSGARGFAISVSETYSLSEETASRGSEIVTFGSPSESTETQNKKSSREEKKKSEKKNSKSEEEEIAIDPKQVENFLKNRGITYVQGVPMEFTVIDGDTLFLDSIEPAWILPKGTRMKGGDWRRYSKLVFNFNKMYPYALVGREMMAQVDSTIEADVSKRSERNRYIKDVEKELFRLFEQDIRSMTITQGFLLLRLVDRECGMSAYDIIRTYESGFAAAFWQLVARLFSQNLKTRYDPKKGEDAKIEELCHIWDSGEWNQFYWSIFMETPPKTIIKSTTLESEVRKKKR